MPTSLQREQHKLIRSRLSSLNFKHPAEPPEPANIKAARKLVKAYDSKRATAHRKAFNAWRDQKRKVEELLLFGKPDEALAALKKLEARRG